MPGSGTVGQTTQIGLKSIAMNELAARKVVPEGQNTFGPRGTDVATPSKPIGAGEMNLPVTPTITLPHLLLRLYEEDYRLLLRAAGIPLRAPNKQHRNS
jgi:hypothetical protein